MSSMLSSSERMSLRPQPNTRVYKSESVDGTDTFVHFYPEQNAVLLYTSDGGQVWLSQWELELIADKVCGLRGDES